MNECDELRAWYFDEVQAARAEVTLSEGRRRVGTTMRVAPEFWWWTPGEVRWLVGEWTRGRDEVDAGRHWAGPARPGMVPAVGAGMAWLTMRGPIPARIVVGFAAMFVFMFAIGRF